MKMEIASSSMLHCWIFGKSKGPGKGKERRNQLKRSRPGNGGRVFSEVLTRKFRKLEIFNEKLVSFVVPR